MAIRLRDDVRLDQLPEDAAARMLGWMQTPEISEAIGLRQPPTLERTRAWLESARANLDISAWGIFMNGEHVGNVVLDQADRKTMTARLSVYIGEASARGRGTGTTAIYRALSQAFGENGFHKVWLTVHAENGAAIKVYSKLGFHVEGTLRGAFVVDGRRLDALYMGLLATEFETLAIER